jgi:alkylation response protein AidB-like acyl-CoA dehydrogenase
VTHPLVAEPDPEELARYRARLRDWLEAHIPAWWRDSRWATPFEVAEDRFDDVREWQRTLFRAGYMGLRWPREYGGQGLSLAHELARADEFQRAKAPPVANTIGITLCGPALLEFGSEAQRRKHLPAILSADEIWVQGYSEPGAGSDLAGLQTRAVREGADWVVNGQKIWTTHGLHGDWIFCLVRTDPHVKKQEGIGFLLIDMRTPGIVVRPIVNATGDREFCEVFFSDVRVPAENMVGAPTQGWQVANHVLRHERGADVSVVRYGEFLNEIAARARTVRRGGRPLGDDPRFRQRWAQLRVEFEVLRQGVVRELEDQRAGRSPGPESSRFKLQQSEFEQRLMRLATDVQGPYGQLWLDGPRGIDAGIWQWRELWSRAYTIYGGSSEIQRNILSERVLGLPRA